MLHNSKFRKSTVVFLVFMLLNLFNLTTFGQKIKSGDFNLSQTAIQNLNIGIKSENTGLKKIQFILPVFI